MDDGFAINQVAYYEYQSIETDTDYRLALNEIEKLMLAEYNTPECEKLDALVVLVKPTSAIMYF